MEKNTIKKLLFILLCLPIFLLSQVPQGVGYQGVATDANGIELVNQSISIRASILSEYDVFKISLLSDNNDEKIGGTNTYPANEGSCRCVR
tara:strand:+ start:411 stop:683 length:273 start_codon:yes stop_codon:yes gene_type:complete